MLSYENCTTKHQPFQIKYSSIIMTYKASCDHMNSVLLKINTTKEHFQVS